MGLMKYQPIQPYTPPESLGLSPQIQRAVWYPLHDDTGSAHACRLGLGPDLTLSGTVGAFWSATRGAVTPDGSTHRLGGPAGDPYLNPLFDLATLQGQELLIAWSFEHDGDATATEAHWCFGRQVAVGQGGYSLRMSSAEQLIFYSQAGAGASGSVTAAFTGSAATGSTARNICVLSLTKPSANALQLVLHRHLVGTGTQAPSVATIANTQVNGGSGGPAAEAVSRLTLCASESGTNTYNQFLGAAAGSNAKMRNFCAVRCSSVQDGLAERGLADLVLAPQEFPRSWRA